MPIKYKINDHSNIRMQLMSSDSKPDDLFAYSTNYKAIDSLFCSSFNFFRTMYESSLSLRKSNRPSEPIRMKSISYVSRMFFISGSDIKPYFLAALSPKARDRARPGPQLFLPGAQILFGPEYLSFPI